MDRHQDSRAFVKKSGLTGEERGGARGVAGRGAGPGETTGQGKELPKYNGWSRSSRTNPARGRGGMNRRSWTHNYNGITFTIVQAKLVTGSDTEEEARTEAKVAHVVNPKESSKLAGKSIPSDSGTKEEEGEDHVHHKVTTDNHPSLEDAVGGGKVEKNIESYSHDEEDHNANKKIEGAEDDLNGNTNPIKGEKQKPLQDIKKVNFSTSSQEPTKLANQFTRDSLSLYREVRREVTKFQGNYEDTEWSTEKTERGREGDNDDKKVTSTSPPVEVERSGEKSINSDEFVPIWMKTSCRSEPAVSEEIESVRSKVLQWMERNQPYEQQLEVQPGEDPWT